MKSKTALTRRTFMGQLALAAGGATSLARNVDTQGQPRTPHIGLLVSNAFPELAQAFYEELREHGFIDGQNVIVEESESAGMLATRDLDFIVAGSLPWAIAVRDANPNMPMVITTCPGMISNGFARSLEHPGGLYTGLDELPPGVTAKRLTLLKTAAPLVKRVALLSTTPGVGGHETQTADAEHAARQLAISVKVYRAKTVAEVDGALAAIAHDRMDGLLNFQGAVGIMKREAIVEFAARQRLPAIYQATMFAEIGGLMTWAPALGEQHREAARLAARILKGAKPGDLPIKHPEKYFLTINAGAAEKIGLLLPPALLAEASRVIEVTR